MDPLALLPYALAAAGGRVAGHDVTALVAAGVTLLQRSAPLVRALAGRRSAVLLPPGAAWLVALAASDGRAMVVLDPHEAASTPLDALLETQGIGAVFTNRALLSLVPSDVPYVLLDDAPRQARVCANGRDSEVDLGTHFALDLIGDSNGDGSPEECLRLARRGDALTHADILGAGRRVMHERGHTPLHRAVWTAVPASLEDFVQCVVAPLLVGGGVEPGGSV
jgi:hypothetical protein